MSEHLSLLLRHPLARMLSASLAMFLALAISFAATEALVPKHLRANWPNAVAALAGALGYWAYARRLECRQVSELDGHGALGDSARGIALGGLLALLTLAPLWGLGLYRINGWGEGTRLVAQVPEMLLVAVLEELLIRGVIFRVAEQAWGSQWAFLLSTVLFVAAHLPGEISWLGVLVTAAASIAFSAASLSGPEWLTGGAYGIEASAMALLVWAAAGVLLLRHAHSSRRAQALRTQPRSQR